MNRHYVVVHHSATKDGETVSWGAIENYHTSYRHAGNIISPDEYVRLKIAGERGLERPWSDIGYHAGVERVGDRFYAMFGRPVNEMAAACRQANMNWLGLHICFVGNYDAEAPPDAMLEVAVKRVIRPWCLTFGIPSANIIGHRDAGLMEGMDWKKRQYKSCPGSQFDLERLREMMS